MKHGEGFASGRTTSGFNANIPPPTPPLSFFVIYKGRSFTIDNGIFYLSFFSIFKCKFARINFTYYYYCARSKVQGGVFQIRERKIFSLDSFLQVELFALKKYNDILHFYQIYISACLHNFI